MYKIYINITLIELVDKKPEVEPGAKELIVKYSGKVKQLLNFIDQAEKGGRYSKITIYHDKYKQLKKDFKELFTVVEAAGGIVVNELDEILFIFRRGHWDLAKGKLEKGESKKNAAIREVKEETGIKQVKLGEKLCITNHVYKIRSGKRMIKKSHWYDMRAPKTKLIPQIEEDITKAQWMTLENFYSKPRKVYISILDVLNQYSQVASKTRV